METESMDWKTRRLAVGVTVGGVTQAASMRAWRGETGGWDGA